MLREDIKIKLIDKDLDKLFLPHRDGVDQANYRVGLIDNEVIAWNPDNNLFMDYFYDDHLEIVWFELLLVYEEGDGYKINRNGEVLGPSGRIIAKLYDTWGYVNYKIHTSKNKKAHLFMAKLFVPNIDPENKKFVDHIDRDKNNILPTNLRWATAKENANNMYRPEHSVRLLKSIFRSYSDPEKTKLVKEYNGLEELKKDFPNNKDIVKNIKVSIKGNYRSDKRKNGYKQYTYNKLYWEIIEDNSQLTNYLNMIGKSIEDIDDLLWTEHYSKKYMVHPLGLVKSANKSSSFRRITPGSITYLNGRHPERRIKGKRVHRLVAEVFLNGNKPISKDLVIDHINTNPQDNRVENLRICTQKENMQNENTIRKLIENPSHTKRVVGPDGTIYNTIKDASKAWGITPHSMWRKLNGRRPSGGFKYYEENDQDNNNNNS